MSINRLIQHEGVAPESPVAATESGTRATVLRAATALFADKGFEGATTRAIAAAAGVNIATVHYHFGPKQALYKAVVAHLYEAERHIVARHVGPLRRAVKGNPEAFFTRVDALVDEFVALYAAEPERARLYMRRWLDAGERPSAAEVAVAVKPFRVVWRVLRHAESSGVIRHGVDYPVVLRAFIWQLYGYFVTGPLDWRGLHSDPTRPDALEAFKAYHRRFVRRMLAAP